MALGPVLGHCSCAKSQGMESAVRTCERTCDHFQRHAVTSPGVCSLLHDRESVGSGHQPANGITNDTVYAALMLRSSGTCRFLRQTREGLHASAGPIYVLQRIGRTLGAHHLPHQSPTGRHRNGSRFCAAVSGEQEPPIPPPDLAYPHQPGPAASGALQLCTTAAAQTAAEVDCSNKGQNICSWQLLVQAWLTLHQVPRVHALARGANTSMLCCRMGTLTEQP